MRTQLRHIHRYKDRHGTLRCYLRIPGQKSVALPGKPGSPEFMRAYQAAISGAAPPSPAQRVAAGSLNAVAVSYYESAAFRGLGDSTQTNYRRIIERLRETHGGKAIAPLDRVGVQKLLDMRNEHPAARNHLLRCLRALMKEAIRIGLRKDDPTMGVERARIQTEGFRTWTEGEIAAYEAKWPSGTVQRLAFTLLLCTGARRSDLVRMGRQHIQGNRLAYRQKKTGTHVTIPIADEMAAELAHVPAGQLTFLVRRDGGPHTENGFYNHFKDWCAAAGLDAELSPHGLRKATARRIAEAGGTAHEIMAITGHKTLSEVEVYTRAADQKRLSEAASDKVAALFAKKKA